MMPNFIRISFTMLNSRLFKFATYWDYFDLVIFQDLVGRRCSQPFATWVPARSRRPTPPHRWESIALKWSTTVYTSEIHHSLHEPGMLAWSLSLTYMQAGYRNHTTSTVSICFSYAYKGDPFCCMFVFSICAICKFKEAHSLVCILKINTILAIFTFEGYAYCVYFGKKKTPCAKNVWPLSIRLEFTL